MKKGEALGHCENPNMYSPCAFQVTIALLCGSWSKRCTSATAIGRTITILAVDIVQSSVEVDACKLTNSLECIRRSCGHIWDGQPDDWGWWSSRERR